MQILTKYDPYPIQQIQFYTNKKSKFTTFKSLIISLIIIILTISVNIPILKNLWIQRSQLDIQQNYKKLDQPFSQNNFLCVISQIVGQSVPKSDLHLNFIQNDTMILLNDKRVPNIKQIQSKLPNFIKQKDYQCYNLNNLSIQNFQYLKLTVYGYSDVIFKTYSYQQFVLPQKNQYYRFKMGQLNFSQNYFKFKKIKGLIYDRLLINYQPQIINGIDSQITLITVYDILQTQNTNTNRNQFYFLSQQIPQTQLTKQIIIKRVNIGLIIGTLLSWFSIFVLIFTICIVPIVQQNFNINLAKLIYQSKKLKQIQPSILSYMKYLLSFFIKNKFNQQIIHIANQNLQKNLNIINLIRRQILIQKLIKQNQIIKTNNEEILSSCYDSLENDNIFDTLDDKDLETQFIQKKQKINEKNHNQKEKFDISIQSENYIFFDFFKTFIKSFDAGQISISLLANKGQGYRNKWNSILTLTFAILVFSLLIFAGFFTLQSNYTMKTVLQTKHKINSIQIKPQDMIFRAIKDMLDQWTFKVTLVDQNFKFIQDVPLNYGQQCKKYQSKLNQTGSNWYCLKQPLILQNDGKNHQKKLYLNLQFPQFSFPFTASKIQIAYKQTNYDTKIYQKLNYIKLFQLESLFTYPLQIFYDQQNDNKLWTTYLKSSNILLEQKGIVFYLLPQILKIQNDSATIWDIIDTSWGICILTFTLILQKITHYLNIKQREKITSFQENTNRNDIVQIVKKHHLLQNSFFKSQLNSVKYFYKENFNKNNTNN